MAENIQTLVAVLNILLFIGGVLGGYKYIILANANQKELMKEVKEIKLVVNEHTLEIEEIQIKMAYEEGFKKGQKN